MRRTNMTKPVITFKYRTPTAAFAFERHPGVAISGGDRWQLISLDRQTLQPTGGQALVIGMTQQQYEARVKAIIERTDCEVL